jgi:hypothetical protein
MASMFSDSPTSAPASRRLPTTKTASGWSSPTTAPITCRILGGVGSGNAFDGNTKYGIEAVGAAVLQVDGASVSSNRLSGLLFNTTSLTRTSTHQLSHLVVRSNGVAGTPAAPGLLINTSSGGVYRIRDSVVLENFGSGLEFGIGSANTLDIGTSTSALGGNTFAGATASTNNKKAGVCVQYTTATGMIPAYGDLWSACPPLQQRVDGCAAAKLSDNVTPFTNVDIAYAAISGAPPAPNPFDVGACSVGP